MSRRGFAATAIRATRIALAFFSLAPASVHGQFGGLQKIKSAVESRLPNLEKLLTGDPPITTSLADVVDEVPQLDGFEPEYVAPMTELPRLSDGRFLLAPGVWQFDAESYCIKAGTYGPSKGDGYVYATLLGPKADIVRKILGGAYKHPDIEQYRIQQLLWGIIARTKVSAMPREVQLVAAKLLSPADLLALNGGALGLIPDDQLKQLVGSVSPALRRVIEAENQLRRLLSAPDATFEQMERIAVLIGAAPPEDGARPVRAGRWAYSPEGYFIRFMPSHYSKTTVQIYYPGEFRVERDAGGTIQAIILADGRRLGAANRSPMVRLASAWTGTTDWKSLAPARPLREFDATRAVATPSGQKQRLAQSGRAQRGSMIQLRTFDETPTRKVPEKDAIDMARDYVAKLSAVNDLITSLTSPMDMISGAAGGGMSGAFFDWLFTTYRQVGDALSMNERQRPGAPDGGDATESGAAEGGPAVAAAPDYQTLTPPRTITPRLATPTRSATPDAVRLHNDVIRSVVTLGTRMEALALAARRFREAETAGDAEWRDRQALAVIHLKHETGVGMLAASKAIADLLAQSPAAGEKAGMPPSRTGGDFTPEIVAQIRELGGEEQLTRMRARATSRAAGPPRDPRQALSQLATAMREYGSFLYAVPETSAPW